MCRRFPLQRKKATPVVTVGNCRCTPPFPSLKHTHTHPSARTAHTLCNISSNDAPQTTTCVCSHRVIQQREIKFNFYHSHSERKVITNFTRGWKIIKTQSRGLKLCNCCWVSLRTEFIILISVRMRTTELQRDWGVILLFHITLSSLTKFPLLHMWWSL